LRENQQKGFVEALSSEPPLPVNVPDLFLVPRKTIFF